jgi:ATP-dependent helicase HepA
LAAIWGMPMWKVGDRLVHRDNPDLGPGQVVQVEGRTVEVEFPGSGTTLRLAADSDALRGVVLRPGTRALLLPSGEPVTVASLPRPAIVRLEDGREVDERQLWPADVGESLTDRLAQGDVDSLEEFSLRLDALHLAAIREADGLGSFLGGRIQLFPHQLYVAERATRTDPVRWLLADEVGLGKTVEACLILNHLLRTGRADRTLVVVPETLTVQWLGELWRKYHQVFVLLDDKRLADVERDFGSGFNPFDVHRRVVIGLESLSVAPRLTEQAAEAGIDLLIVDEAHHLRRPQGHPGNPEYRAIAPLAALGRHLLLLTATPLEDDVHGYFRLLQLLRPDEFADETGFGERLRRGDPLPPCTSSTRRDDIGGLPPRVARPVELPDDASWSIQAALEAAVRAEPAANAVARRKKLERIRRALGSGAALDVALDPSDSATRKLARRASNSDPRIDWLARQARGWRDDGEKTLVFVAQRETLEAIKAGLSRRAQLRVGVFHEDLSPGQQDIEVAQFHLPGGPSMLISTECGGEGRNFQFCKRLVLFDLPWNPMAVEQRIGRLDRIGRQVPVEIVYFRPPAGLGVAVVRLYEALGLFRQPLGGLERELEGVESSLDKLALSEKDSFEASRFDAIVSETRDAYDRVRRAAYHELHRDPFESSMAGPILERVPPELGELTQEIILSASEHLGLHVEEHRRGLRHSIELGSQARVESLPGVPPGASFLGTFVREEAVDDESIDFFASGHPLVEGILAHLEESPLGRVALLDARGATEVETFGLLAIYRRGVGFDALAVDATGNERPEWAGVLTRRPLKSRRVNAESWTDQPSWPELIRSLAARLEGRGRPVAVAAVRIRP